MSIDFIKHGKSGCKDYFDDVADQWDSMRQSFFSEAVREKAYAVAGIEGAGLPQISGLVPGL